MNNLYIDIYTEEGCNPELVDESECMEIKASVIQQWAKANGMALVPLEPTTGMKTAFIDTYSAGDTSIRDIYKAMIKAAQEPME